MIVVLSGEERDVDQAHRRAQAGMARRAFQRRPVGPFQKRDESKPQGPEVLQEMIQRSIVMVGVVCSAIGEIRDRQVGFPRQHLFRPSYPEGLEVAEVADVLLYGPRVADPGVKRGSGKSAEAFFNTRRAASQSLQDVRIS